MKKVNVWCFGLLLFLSSWGVEMGFPTCSSASTPLSGSNATIYPGHGLLPPDEIITLITNPRVVNPYHIDLSVPSAVEVILNQNQTYGIQLRGTNVKRWFIVANKLETEPDNWTEQQSWGPDSNEPLTLKSSEFGKTRRCLISLWVPEGELGRKGDSQPIPIPYVDYVKSITTEAGKNVQHFELKFREPQSGREFQIVLSRPVSH